MNELEYGHTVAVPQTRSVATIFGWVMGLVGISLGFLALGAYLGRDLSHGAAIGASLAAVGMLLVGSFWRKATGVGAFGITWLFATAALLGLGAGPMLQYYLDVNVAYRQACLNAIEYLQKFGYSGAQAYSILGTAPVQGHISGVVDVPNACATLWLPTEIFDFDINPTAAGPIKMLDGSIDMPISPDVI